MRVTLMVKNLITILIMKIHDDMTIANKQCPGSGAAGPPSLSSTSIFTETWSKPSPAWAATSKSSSPLSGEEEDEDDDQHDEHDHFDQYNQYDQYDVMANYLL